MIDLRSLAPLDKEAILATVKKTNRVMILHEASLTGGIGGELSAIIAEEAFEWLDAPIIRVASIDYARAVRSADGRLLSAEFG